MNDAISQIQVLAEEAQTLYRVAAKQHLSPVQMDRLHEIQGRLPGLWDLHRREVVATRRPETKEHNFAYLDAA